VEENGEKRLDINDEELIDMSDSDLHKLLAEQREFTLKYCQDEAEDMDYIDLGGEG
jgi:hypothetical protein